MNLVCENVNWIEPSRRGHAIGWVCC